MDDLVVESVAAGERASRSCAEKNQPPTPKIKRILISSLVLMALGAGLCSRADVVTEWNKAALDAICADRTPPPRASRNLAILHASIYDAVDGMSRTHKAYFVQSAVPALRRKRLTMRCGELRLPKALFRSQPWFIDESSSIQPW